MLRSLAREQLQIARLLRPAALGLIAVSLALLIAQMPVRAIAEGIERLSDRLGPWSAAVYVAAVVLFSLLCIPSWPMPFLAGALFGPWKGAALASFSTVAACAVSWGVARGLRRTVFRDALEASVRLRALERAIQKSSWRVVAAVRVSHFLPFGMQNYAFGLLDIRLSTVILTTWLVTLPGTILQAYLGHLGLHGMDSPMKSLAEEWQVWGIRLAGMGLIVSAMIYLGHFARSVYRETLHEELDTAFRREQAVHPERGWGTALLTALALALSITAGVATMHRDWVRQRIEQWIEERTAVALPVGARNSACPTCLTDGTPSTS